MCFVFIFGKIKENKIYAAIFFCLRQHEDIRLFPMFGCGGRVGKNYSF